MADRPPGRHAEGGSPVQGNRLHTTTSPSQQGPDAASVLAVALEHAERGWPVPPAQVIRAGLLGLSDERDLWLRRVYGTWRDGWRAGFEAGDAAGTRRTQREWHVTAIGLPLLVLGPAWAELERRRYGPGGRAHSR